MLVVHEHPRLTLSLHSWAHRKLKGHPNKYSVWMQTVVTRDHAVSLCTISEKWMVSYERAEVLPLTVCYSTPSHPESHFSTPSKSSKYPSDQKLEQLAPRSLSSKDVRNTPPRGKHLSQTTALQESDNRNQFFGRNLQNHLKRRINCKQARGKVGMK